MYQESKELVSAPAKVGKWHELAEAIRAGCKLRPLQCFGMSYDGPLAACAIGAARLITKRRDDGPPVGVGRCPEGCTTFNGYLFLVLHLNDDHRWSREKIADFLDAL